MRASATYRFRLASSAAVLLFFSAVPALVHAATPAEIYAERCASCHTPGTSGAPKLGDRAEWSQRVRPGVGLLYKSALDGVPNTEMLPKGGHADLTDDDVKAVVDFMIAVAQIPDRTLKAAARYEAFGNTNRDFIRLDKSFDGFLSPRELRADPALAQGYRRFDLNGDGKLSEREYLKAKSGADK